MHGKAKHTSVIQLDYPLLMSHILGALHTSEPYALRSYLSLQGSQLRAALISHPTQLHNMFVGTHPHMHHVHLFKPVACRASAYRLADRRDEYDVPTSAMKT
jgi:hypothetical protein